MTKWGPAAGVLCGMLLVSILARAQELRIYDRAPSKTLQIEPGSSRVRVSLECAPSTNQTVLCGDYARLRFFGPTKDDFEVCVEQRPWSCGLRYGWRVTSRREWSAGHLSSCSRFTGSSRLARFNLRKHDTRGLSVQ